MKKHKPMFDEARPLSWSAISQFEYDREEWYRKYVLGIREDANKEMLFGSMVGKRLETDPSFLPMIPRESKMEHKFLVQFGKIPMVGYADTFCTMTNRKLKEYKTGKKEWDQKRVDSHGQLDMYLLMNYITTKVKPEDTDIELVWMPTQENADFTISFVDDIESNIKIFRTRRTMADILRFGAKINKTYEEMKEYAKNHI